MLGDMKLLWPDGSRPEYTDFEYLKTGTDITDNQILDDLELFKEVQKVFVDLGFSPKEIESIYKTIACVLLLG